MAWIAAIAALGSLLFSAAASACASAWASALSSAGPEKGMFTMPVPVRPTFCCSHSAASLARVRMSAASPGARPEAWLSTPRLTWEPVPPDQ